MKDYRILQGDVRDVLATLPDESVHCVITSPPYWGLRDYGTGQWTGGAADCDHKAPPTGGPNPERYTPGGSEMWREANDKLYQDVCGKCGATRVDRQLGLEPTPGEFVQHMVEIFRDVRRVLRRDGTLWLNMGDSYAGGPGGSQGNTGQRASRTITTPNTRKDTVEARRGSGLKPKDLVGMPWRVAFALQEDGWWLRSAITWCLSGGTRLYARTQKGDMPAMLKDLVRLDPATVQLWNGEKWTQVEAWTRAPERDGALEIELRNGERIGCTPEHLWPTQRGNVRADELQVGDVIPTTRLPERGLLDARMPKQLPSWLGWFIGFYLAEGHKSGRHITLAVHAGERDYFDKCAYVAHAYHGTATFRKRAGNAAVISMQGKVLNGILDTYISGEDCHTKHLTTAAWQRNDLFLEEVLKGYLAGDGHYEPDTKRWRVGFTNNDALAADLRTICARLGYTCRLRRVTHQIGDKRYPGWRGHIRVEPSTDTRTRADGEVVAIRNSRARQFWDVSVADAPNLFALASGVLTHNCKRAPMPESVTDRPTSATEMIFLLAKSERYYYDADAVRSEPTSNPNGLTWGQRKELGEGMRRGESHNAPQAAKAHWQAHTAGRNLWNYWLLGPEPYAAAHFATFPTAIPDRCIRAGTSERGCCPECGAPWKRVVEREATPDHIKAQFNAARVRTAEDHGREDGFTTRKPNYTREVLGTTWQPTCKCGRTDTVPATVLDPFSGAGTTALVALRLGRRAIGIELNGEYIAMSHKRIQGDPQAMNLNMELVDMEESA